MPEDQRPVPPQARANPRLPEDRRVVTIVFADVVGSTAFADGSDPEDVRAILGGYYAIAREVIQAHGGTIEKFIGDAVMAVFGIPQAHGDDAERALVASMALQEAAARGARTAGLVLRFGVNTGEVVASRQTEGGDFLVTGDAVNVAARLQQHADPGSILVGERTMRAVSGFRFATPQRIEVKGKPEPIVGAALLERVPERRAEAPFLGRAHDLAQLELVARRAFSERRPQLVTITAPAGTGKSRLVEEFATRIAGEAALATAQCLPYGAAVTFLPLQGLARGLLQLGPEAEILPALRDAFARAGCIDADSRRLSALVSAMIGDASDSERVDREEIFTAWRLLIEVRAAEGALLVVFEDLHWASDTLLDLVEHLTVSRAAAPLVMVALARAELLDRRPHWGSGRRNFTSLALEPLSHDETLRLVGMLAEGAPDAIARRIAERAGGNPFFVGELVRAYEERRRAGDVDSDILLPDTVHATVLARIDGLAPLQRSVLEFAAVAGRTACVEDLCALLPGIARADLREALEAMLDCDLMTSTGAGAYTFRHIVIREVAYATLPRVERVRAHLRLVRSLEAEETSGGNDVAELVAYHYRQAIALSPGGRLPEGMTVGAVVAALERVARIASGAGAHGEARQQIQEAIRLAPPAEHTRLYEVLGDLMQFGDEAVDAYTEAFTRWRDAGASDPRVGARLLIRRLAVEGRWTGSLARPLETAEFNELASAARTLLDLAPNETLEATLACAKAFEAKGAVFLDREAMLAGLLRPAITARELFARRGDAEAESEALDAISALHRGAGDFESALAAQRERIANTERLGLLERVDAWSVAIWDLVNLGRFHDAVQMFAEARAALRVGEPEYMLAHAISWTIYAAMLCGRWDEALLLGDTLLEYREHSPRNVGRFSFPGWIGALRVASARLDTSRLARYRSALTAVADLAHAGPSVKSLFQAVLEGDPALAHSSLAHPTGARDRKGEIVAMLLFELGERLGEDEIAAVEHQAHVDPPMMTLRLVLARALNAGDRALRGALAQLDAAELVADAARASALLALRTHEEIDRAEARRRLGALGDRAYLQKLAEEW